jgi:uncharacterized surface protein with fasciclin (FAS1) repeats
MRPLLTLIAAALVAAPLAFSQASAADPAGKDILSVAQASGNFTTLTRAIEAAGLTQALKDQGPITLFAPTDEAFAKLPAAELEALLQPENKDKLTRILGMHVVNGAALDTATLKKRSSYQTQAGEVDVRLKNGRLRVGDARVTGDDIRASNGVIHAIDRVIMPAS